MEFQTLKKNHRKRNILIGVMVVAIISACILTFTRAKYRTTKSIKVAEGMINYKVPDLNLVSLYIQSEEGTYVEADAIPTSGYKLNEAQSYCGISNNGEITKDESVNIIYENSAITFSNVTKKGTKCYLYFDEGSGSAADVILAGKNIDSSRSGVITGILTTNTTGTVSIEDDDGISYLYAGAVDNNWVSFAGYYWRIIRINGDNSIRMIYAGTSYGISGTDDQIQTSAYNDSTSQDNAYVGYMFGNIDANNYESTHTNTNNSTIKEVLDQWYEDNLLNYSDYISTEAGFCNDRKTQSEVWTGYGDLGYGTNTTAYAPAGRLFQNGWKSSQTPTLKCSQITNDLFTVSGSSKGNHALIYPIGIITSDEVVLAGGFGGQNNNSYYLFTNQDYWTMSPSSYNPPFGYPVVMNYVNSNGAPNFGTTLKPYGVRPVINLRADVSLTGTGTSTDPYQVS